jgi:hypothetical protein
MGFDDIDPAITQAIIFHRKMGSMDESSTDEEQGEKILFYYPVETPLYWQVIVVYLIIRIIRTRSNFDE